MKKEKVQLTFGALLHDVGKVVYRGMSEQGTHSKLGANFVVEAISADEPLRKEIVEQVRYHHAGELGGASLSPNSLAYITYFADNISAGMDRKEEGADSGFDRSAKLRRIFNILNGHHDDNVIEHADYNVIRERIRAGLVGIPLDESGVGSLLNLLEATCDSVPSSTDKAQLIDVSLFDHAKTTAAIAACLYDYLEAEGVGDYRKALFDRNASSGYYGMQTFLLWSCDLSGIQSFIYQISGAGALKQLRARSFYLEMLLEHVMDELLSRLDLTRCNLLYTGGGHAYALLPNTQAARETLQAFSDELKSWLLERFRTDLYCASAFVACSANDLMNKADEMGEPGRYRLLFGSLSSKLSAAKANRYAAADIASLNFSNKQDCDHARECSECHRSDVETSETADGAVVCSLCASLGGISPKLVKPDAVFVVSDAGRANSLELPFGRYLETYEREEYLAKKPEAVRIYTKRWDTGINLATHIWMGDYTADAHHNGIGDYAESGIKLEGGKGVKRLGVLRADVDNLGAAFSSGLPEDKASISRTATLSRALSYFFKHEMNDILEQGSYRAQIIYSGGDDLFLVGNWDDVIYAALDIRTALDDFTGNGVLTISAGVGMYDAKYPIARMAAEVGELEEAAKACPSKNAIALWAEGNAFSWDDFIASVQEKLPELRTAFDKNDKGKAFIYKLIDLLRNVDDAISIPRLAYLLARSFEDDKEHGTEVSKKLFNWANDENERKCLITALEWYVYSIRERG